MNLTRHYGRKCGFPRCCIAHFEKRMAWPRSRVEAYNKKHAHATMGYIPCPRCSPAVAVIIRQLREEMNLIFPRKRKARK